MISARDQASSAKGFITCIPAVFADGHAQRIQPGSIPFPGRPRPRTSVKPFMEFAVNIPDRNHMPGQELLDLAGSSLIRFAFLLLPRNTVFKSLWLMEASDRRIRRYTEGSDALPIIMPERSYHSSEMNTSASKQFAFTTRSMVSASAHGLKEKLHAIMAHGSTIANTNG